MKKQFHKLKTLKAKIKMLEEILPGLKEIVGTHLAQHNGSNLIIKLNEIDYADWKDYSLIGTEWELTDGKETRKWQEFYIVNNTTKIIKDVIISRSYE